MVGGIDPEDAENGAEPSPFGFHQLDLFFNGWIYSPMSIVTHMQVSIERAFLYPRPDGEPLSVGSFRNLPLSPESVIADIDGDGTSETVQKMAGMPWGGKFKRSFRQILLHRGARLRLDDRPTDAHPCKTKNRCYRAKHAGNQRGRKPTD